MSDSECPKCGSFSKPESKFCPKCGESLKQTELVQVALKDARVIYASRTLDELPDDFFLTSVDSDLYRSKGLPFDSSRIPSQGDLVPADCIWACFAHPGYLRPAKRGQKLLDKYKQIAAYTGRTLTELCGYFGEPEVKMSNDKITTVVWSEVTLSRITQIQFYFDKYEVCIEVGEINEYQN